MKAYPSILLVGGGLLLSAWSTLADDAPSPATAASGAKAVPVATVTTNAVSGPSSPAVADILKMLQAGVSPDVVRTFVQNSQTPFELTASDVVLLRQRGVPDDITNAMLKRAGELRASNPQGGSNGPAAQPGSATVPLRIVPAYHGFDPDSYAYFHYYYLHPRTLASVYQRLGGYGPYTPSGLGFQPFGYGTMRWVP